MASSGVFPFVVACEETGLSWCLVAGFCLLVTALFHASFFEGAFLDECSSRFRFPVTAAMAVLCLEYCLWSRLQASRVDEILKVLGATGRAGLSGSSDKAVAISSPLRFACLALPLSSLCCCCCCSQAAARRDLGTTGTTSLCPTPHHHTNSNPPLLTAPLSHAHNSLLSAPSVVRWE